MIEFKKKENEIIAIYTTGNDIKWLLDIFEDGESYRLHKSFNFSSKELITDLSKLNKTEEDIPSLLAFGDSPPLEFKFAKLVDNDYYLIKKGILSDNINIFLHKDIELDKKLFVTQGTISIFGKIGKLVNEDVYIGGENQLSISENDFINLIESFPKQYEKKLYVDSRISGILKEYFATTKDANKSFQNYLSKKNSFKGEDLTKTFKEVEIIKYETILDKLQRMLSDENDYSENQWQKEILQIILLLYPKYIFVFEEVPVKADDIKDKFLDYLLVDSNGNVDIVEIKKPFNNSIMTKGVYRNNYIPLRELSGTVMQIEKYIYFLNRWSLKGEKKLTEKYKDKLPKDFNIKITNPNGMIIMGRENKLSEEQKRDFEVVKRKYKNVIDIISYDNLLDRLKFTIEQIKKV